MIVGPDPMLATGGSAEAAINFVKRHGGKKIKFMCIIAAPEGKTPAESTSGCTDLLGGCVDRELNEDAYICPGLGMPETVSLGQNRLCCMILPE